MAVSVTKSPSYPRLPLDRAIELTKQIYDSAYDSEIDTQTVLSLMGFQGVSGASATALSSLKQFGLVEGRDRRLRITPLTKQILLPISEDEKRRAVLHAADNPTIYKSIKSHFGGKYPADQVIKAHLIRNFGFSSAGVEHLLKGLRETENFVGPLREFAASSSETNLNQDAPPIDDSIGQASLDQASENVRSDDLTRRNVSGEEINIRISKDAVVRLLFSGPVTKAAIEKLMKLLDLMKEDYPDSDQPS